MAKFCSNCGSELNSEQDVCLKCGKVILKEDKIEEKSKDPYHKTYKTITGIIMIILGVCLMLASDSTDYKMPLLVYTIPGLFGLISGILSLNSKKNPSLLMPSAIILFAGSLVNFIGILDISIFTILAVCFGIFNIKFFNSETKLDNK